MKEQKSLNTLNAQYTCRAEEVTPSKILYGYAYNVNFAKDLPDGVRFVERTTVNVCDIYVPVTTENIARKAGKIPSHIVELSNSLRNYYDLTQPLIVVEVFNDYGDDGKFYKFKIVDGHNRLAAVLNYGSKTWVVDVYWFKNKDKRIDFQIRSNDFLPVKTNTQEDIVNVIFQKVENGTLNGNLKDIKVWLLTHCPHISNVKQILNKVVKVGGDKIWTDEIVYNDLSTQKRCMEKCGCDKHPAVGYTYDLIGDSRDARFRSLEQAVTRYLTDGIKTEFIVHTIGSSDKLTLNQRRLNIRDEFNSLVRRYTRAFQGDGNPAEKFMEVKYALPQDRKNEEDFERLISFDNIKV